MYGIMCLKQRYFLHVLDNQTIYMKMRINLCWWNCEKLEIVLRKFLLYMKKKKHGFFNISIWNKWKGIFSSFISSFVSFRVCLRMQRKIKFQTEKEISSKEYITRTRFKFLSVKLWSNKSLIMACLQNCWELLSLANFLELIQT